MRRPRVLVIDAGLGNIGSVMAALQRQNCTVQRLSQPPAAADTDCFSHAVLPGVGAFAAGMRALEVSGWEAWIKQVWCKGDHPLLGICLGMQLLASEGSEGASNGCSTAGLDLIPGNVRNVKVGKNLVLPHVGWNSLNWKTNTNPISKGIPDGGDMYYVHSYCFQASDSKHVLANTNYGEVFTSVVGKSKCYGVQFHPEKSQRLGRRLLENFLTLPTC